MVEIIVDKFLERISKFHEVELKRLARKSYTYSRTCGFSPANKFNVLTSNPGLTVANKESSSLLNIHLDMSSLLIEDKILREHCIFFQITHELSHASISDIGILDMVHYNLLKGKFVSEYSYEEFQHVTKTLKENVVIDSRLGEDDFVRRSFFLNNIVETKLLTTKLRDMKKERKKKKVFHLDYDKFKLITEILHISSVAGYLKGVRLNKNVECQIANDIGRLFHNSLKGSIGNFSINNQLQKAYVSLIDLCHNNNTKNIRVIDKVMKNFWDTRKDLA